MPFPTLYAQVTSARKKTLFTAAARDSNANFLNNKKREKGEKNKKTTRM
jgi:hypothetical protein